MAESQSNSRANTPGASLPVKRIMDEDHVPAISSPLNPNPDATSRARPRAPPREQREKRETMKKREASSNTRGSTPNPRTAKKERPSADSPMRYSVPEPKPTDYLPPKDGIFLHEPPLLAPDGTELRRPIDHAWNKKGYRYTHAVADPQFRHKQFYRQTDSKPYGPRMSHEDTDRWFSFDDTATIITQEKGWRMGRGNVVAREGTMYYEVKVLKGIPMHGPQDPLDPKTGETKPGPHIRMGWARREAPLDGPVGFDGYSYGITDTRFEAQHRSRASKIFKPLPKGVKSKHMKARPPPNAQSNRPVEYVSDEHIQEGDVIGLEIKLPALSLHRKVVENTYHSAVDKGDGFDAKEAYDPTEKPLDIIRDRIPVGYKGNFFFEQLDHNTTKAVESYHDRGPVPKVHPDPNHEDVSLRSLPDSHIKMYKNGKYMGIAFESLLAFLPPASVPSAEALKAGARVGFDDGMVGYFPAVSVFNKGVAQVNFGPDFWCPPEAMLRQRQKDTQMQGNHAVEEHIPDGRKSRAIGERYKEQIAEDVVWDIIDEVDFFVQDGGWNYTGETPQDVAGKSTPKARGFANPDENVGVEVGRRY